MPAAGVRNVVSVLFPADLRRALEPRGHWRGRAACATQGQDGTAVQNGARGHQRRGRGRGRRAQLGAGSWLNQAEPVL